MGKIDDISTKGDLTNDADEYIDKKSILVFCQYYHPEPFRISDMPSVAGFAQKPVMSGRCKGY